MKTNFTSEHFLAKWLEGNLTEEELTQFKGDDAFEEFEKIQRESAAMSLPAMDLDKGWEKLNESISEQPKRVGRRRVLWYSMAAAASLVLLLFFSGLFGTDEFNLNTNIANHTEHLLPDQSKITLNSASSLQYAQQDWSSDRMLSLEGEAFLEVEKAGPFVVNTTEGTVSVLGTSFNVYSRNGNFNVVCYTGKVKVSRNSDDIILNPGESVILKDGHLVKSSSDLKSAPSWINGESKFTSAKLEDVLEEFQRQYPVKVNVKRNTDEPATIAFPHNNIDKALKIICGAYGVKSDKKNSEIVIY